MSRKMQPVDTGERDKMNKSETSASGKVEWLYSGDKIDRDAYLLGKPIDKLLLEKQAEKPKTEIVTSAVDLANKIREDPLFEIKKREIEAKKRLLENPLKLKQLQQMLASTEKKTKEVDSDDSDDETRSSHRNKRHHHHNRDKRDHRQDEKPKRRSRSRSRSRSPPGRHPQGYGLTKAKQEPTSSGSVTSSDKTREIEEYKKRINKLKDMRTSGPSEQRVSSKAMSEEDRRRKLEEMQSNAKWRDQVRSKNMKKFEADEKHERKLEEVSHSSRMQVEASSMFNNIMKDAYKSTEERIRSNIYNIQRNKSSYDANFARK